DSADEALATVALSSFSQNYFLVYLRDPRFNFSTNLLSRLPGGPIQLQFDFAAAPLNDSFSDALAVNLEHGAVTNSNLSATRQPNEPVLPGTPVGHTIWYRWIAPANGYLQLGLASTQEVVAAVYSGSHLGDLALEASNAYRLGYDLSHYLWFTRAQFGVPVHGGQAYFIAVDTSDEAAAKKTYDDAWIDPNPNGFAHFDLYTYPYDSSTSPTPAID